MDASTAVSNNAAVSLIGFAIVIFLLLFLIAKWKWHVFSHCLFLLCCLVFPGVQQNNFIDAFESGFGNTLGSIGVVIVLGSIIAEALKHTGAIQVITKSMVNLVGTKRMPLALTLTGFVIGIAIFSDVAYVILNPLCILPPKQWCWNRVYVYRFSRSPTANPCHCAANTWTISCCSYRWCRYRQDHYIWRYSLSFLALSLVGHGDFYCRGHALARWPVMNLKVFP